MIQIVIYYGVAPPVIQERGVVLEKFVLAYDRHRLDVFIPAKQSWIQWNRLLSALPDSSLSHWTRSDWKLIFTAQHEMQTRYSDENSVRLPVCLPAKRVHCDKMDERCVQIFIQSERPFSLVFSEEEWLVEATPSTWNVGSTGPRWSEIVDFEPIFARSASAKKVQLTLTGSPLRAFQWAYKIIIVRCP